MPGKGIVANLDKNGYVEFKINTEGSGIRGTDLFKQMMEHFGSNAKLDCCRFWVFRPPERAW
jgi:hypothetical protein